MFSLTAAAPVAMFAADTGANGLTCMHVLDCGRLITKDQARWTTGINAGRPRELPNPCYLFDGEQSLASIERVAGRLARHKVRLWIGHGRDLTTRIHRAPRFYE